MPRKLRDLRADLRRAGFRNRGGKGKHENWRHPMVRKGVTLSGKDSSDAKDYQEDDVREALADLARAQAEQERKQRENQS